MAKEQYVATDKVTDFQVSVTGEFPPHPDDRMRIARTTTLFTRLMSTLLTKEESERRTGFRAVETQLELAEALIRQDMEEVRRLVRETMGSMGVTQDQLDELARQLRDLGGIDEATAEQISQAFGIAGDAVPPEEPRQEPAVEPPFEAASEPVSTDEGQVEEVEPEAPSEGGGSETVIDLPPPASSYAPPHTSDTAKTDGESADPDGQDDDEEPATST